MSAPRAHDPPDAGRPQGPSADVSTGDEDLVAVLRWPDEADARHALAEVGRPRLLVVGADDPPPLVWDDREDWIREGAGPVETATRIARLAASEPGGTRRPRPVLDADGVLHASGGRIAVIPPVEATLLGALLDRADHVVRREDLHRAAWPSGSRDERAVDGRVRGLRRRIEGMGITIHTVRGVGYLLEVDRA